MSRPKITTSDIAPDFNHSIDLASNIAAEDIERPDLAIATDTNLDDPTTNKYVRDLAFMEEVVTFVVSKTKDKNEPNPIIAGCNGINKIIELGKIQQLPRKFLNVLINTVTDISTHEYVDQDGLKQTRIQTLGTPSLQIQLMQDPSGQKGFEWFSRAYHGTY